MLPRNDGVPMSATHLRSLGGNDARIGLGSAGQAGLYVPAPEAQARATLAQNVAWGEGPMPSALWNALRRDGLISDATPLPEDDAEASPATPIPTLPTDPC